MMPCRSIGIRQILWIPNVRADDNRIIALLRECEIYSERYRVAADDDDFLVLSHRLPSLPLSSKAAHMRPAIAAPSISQTISTPNLVSSVQICGLSKRSSRPSAKDSNSRSLHGSLSRHSEFRAGELMTRANGSWPAPLCLLSEKLGCARLGVIRESIQYSSPSNGVWSFGVNLAFEPRSRLRLKLFAVSAPDMIQRFLFERTLDLVILVPGQPQTGHNLTHGVSED